MKITVKSVSRITAQTSKSTYYLGENIDKNTITVTAYYSDGTSSVLNSNEFEVTGFGNTLGKQTLTVTYLDKTAYLTIQLLEANIAALNKLYETSSTTSELTTAQIGSYAGDFTIEHTVKINSMPANGDDNKRSTNGFFVRFNPSDGIRPGPEQAWQEPEINMIRKREHEALSHWLVQAQGILIIREM